MSTKRRGRGEGSITQRSDGRWMARVDLGWREGKRRYKAVYGRTRRDVAGKLTKTLKAVQDGSDLPDERVTVAKFLDRWLEHKRLQLRSRAWLTYEQAVRLHLNPGIGTVAIAKLKPQQLEAWFLKHQEAGASARAVRYARTVFRAALNQARKWGTVSQNVAALVDPPRHTPKEIKPLTPSQARTLLTASRDHRLGGLISVATALGLRLGEAQACAGATWTSKRAHCKSGRRSSAVGATARPGGHFWPCAVTFRSRSTPLQTEVQSGASSGSNSRRNAKSGARCGLGCEQQSRSRPEVGARSACRPL